MCEYYFFIVIRDVLVGKELRVGIPASSLNLMDKTSSPSAGNETQFTEGIEPNLQSTGKIPLCKLYRIQALSSDMQLETQTENTLCTLEASVSASEAQRCG